MALITISLHLSWLSGAQDLDPRAYLRLPVKTTNMITGLAFSKGDILTDPTLTVKDLNAAAQTASLGVAHSFSLLGLSSQVMVVMPYSWAQFSGNVNAVDTSTSRSGFSDMRMRLSVLVVGGRACTLAELIKAPRKTIVGVSLNVAAPTGEFNSGKLINLGTNRWSFRPELALSQPLFKRWMVDVYAGLWLFTPNNSFFPGNARRIQDPMGTFQAHISYNINPLLWIAFDATYYVGGQSAINGIYNDDRQSNSRIGVTAVLPTGKFSSLKLAASTGAVVRVGQDFTTFSIGWQRTWLADMKRK